MIAPPIPADEQNRLNALYQMGLLDTPPEERFDAITKQAVQRYNAMLSTISILDKDREWFKSCSGIPMDKEEPRETSFCGHALAEKTIFIIEDATKDPRFIDNPHVVGPPFVRFYAGVALYDHATNQPIGVFCIKDNKPRKFDERDIADLLAFAKQAEHELNVKPIA